MKNSNLVILNTLILYFKMAITILVSLYSVRIVLSTLGQVDYGIYNVIMGIVSMLSFLNVALSVSTQRYLSFYQGKNDPHFIKKILNHSLLLHFFLGCAIIIILEILGTYVISNYLQIPGERFIVAKYIYHFAVVAVFFTFLSVPYTALINANEKMIFIALVSIFESFLKLIIAFYISYTTYDKLLIYGVLCGCVPVFSFLFYFFICQKKFKENVHFCLRPIDITLLKEISFFACWNLVGSVTSMSKNQGVAVLLNVFKGPAVNAAYAVANQISSQLIFFSATMMRSLNPQIMKSEGAGNRKHMLYLTNMACKYSYLLLAFFSIPCMFEMETLMSLWLGVVPQYTVFFCDCILIAMMFDQITIGLNSGFQACKLVKYSSIFVGIVKMMIIPLGYVALTYGCSPIYVVVFYAFVEFLAGWVRLLLAKKMMGLNLKIFFSDVYYKILYPTAISVLCCIIIVTLFSFKFRIVITIFVSFLSFILFTYYFSLDRNEKNYVLNVFSKIFDKYVKFN